MHKLNMLLLCAVILLTGCAANADPEIFYAPKITPDITASSAPLPELSATPLSASDKSMAMETADTNSNIDNGGLAVANGDTIFIATDNLYMMDKYCRVSTVLLDSPDVCFLNIYGDYLYFVNATDYSVYRMNLDGQDLRKLPISGAFNLVAAGGSLFYQYSVGEDSDNLLYRSDLLGLQTECLNITASNLCAGETGLYFSNKDDNGYLYKYSFTDEVIVKIRSDSPKQINIAGGSIYYIAGNEDNKIVSIHSTGSGREIIVDEPCRYLNHIGTSLVFSTMENSGIEKISFDGNDRSTVLAVRDAHAFNIAGDYIFFESFPLPSMDAITYRIRLDGTGLNPEFPERSLALIKDFDIQNMTIELDYVELLTGDDAVDAYSYDNGYSKKRARITIENELKGTYLRNQSPKIRELKLTNYTNITLITRSDGSINMQGYSASNEDFAALYTANCEACKSLLYFITASDGEIISMEQRYFEGTP